MSRATVGEIDEARVRKVAADNPDLLDCRLAQRFGISVGKLRKILGRPGRQAELLHTDEMTKAAYTPRPGLGFACHALKAGGWKRRNELERQLARQAPRSEPIPSFAGKIRPPNRPAKTFRTKDEER